MKITEIVPQRVQRHAVYGGTSYGPRQRILVEGPISRLMFVPGRTSYISRTKGAGYTPATLYLVRDDMSLSRRVILEVPGVRLGAALLLRPHVAFAVVQEWGQLIAQKLNHRGTIEIDGGNPQYPEGT